MKQFVAEASFGAMPNNLRVTETLNPQHSSSGFLTDVMKGLAATPKQLPPKHFYDRHGSELFDAICRLPEYYPTRTEMGLLHAHAADIARLAGPAAHVIEFGSGATIKVQILLNALDMPASYVGVDISRDYLIQAAQALAYEYPHMPVVAVCADFTRKFRMPTLPGRGPRLGFFPGSTSGNLLPEEAGQFLRHAAEVLGRGGAMVVGVDLQKDPEILNAAYNDAQGITAAFNLNLLRRINAELGGTFDLRQFAHDAFCNHAAGRIEMHLRSLVDQEVRVRERAFAFKAGETIHTENSHKYTVAQFQELAREAGFRPLRAWVDTEHLFSVHYLTVPR